LRAISQITPLIISWGVLSHPHQSNDIWEATVDGKEYNAKDASAKLPNRALYRNDDESDEVSILKGTFLYGRSQRYVQGNCQRGKGHNYLRLNI